MATRPARRPLRRWCARCFANDDFDVSVYDLSSAHDIRNTVVRTLLTYLELAGHIERGTPFYAKYQFKPLVTSAEILGHFDGERRSFWPTCSAGEEGEDLVPNRSGRGESNIGEPRDRVVRALDYLAEQGHGTEGRRRAAPVQGAPSARRYGRPGRLVARKVAPAGEREIARLGQVAAVVEHDGCQVSALGGHFGDPLSQPCGHCSWCLQGGRPSRLPPRPEPRIDPAAWSQGLALRQQYAAELRNPRSLARFLCGVSSPHLVRAKLQKHPLFGVMSHVPFPVVLERVESSSPTA